MLIFGRAPSLAGHSDLGIRNARTARVGNAAGECPRARCLRARKWAQNRTKEP